MPNKKSNKLRPTQEFPEVMEFFVDFAKLARKYNTRKLSSILTITRQSFEQQVKKGAIK